MRDLVNEQDKTCMEQKCIVEFEGKKFESGGSFIGIDKKTGLHGGIVYGDYHKRIVSNWHGDIKVNAMYGNGYSSNMGDSRCHVWFTYKGINFHGIWCGMEWSQIIRVKEVK
jgi:hypothetical protein